MTADPAATASPAVLGGARALGTLALYGARPPGDLPPWALELAAGDVVARRVGAHLREISELDVLTGLWASAVAAASASRPPRGHRSIDGAANLRRRWRAHLGTGPQPILTTGPPYNLGMPSLSVSERSVQVEGIRLHVRESGDGPPVLLINGIGAHVGMWAPIGACLPGMRMIAFDAPGTGRSATSAFPLSLELLSRLHRTASRPPRVRPGRRAGLFVRRVDRAVPGPPGPDSRPPFGPGSDHTRLGRRPWVPVDAEPDGDASAVLLAAVLRSGHRAADGRTGPERCGVRPPPRCYPTTETADRPGLRLAAAGAGRQALGALRGWAR